MSEEWIRDMDEEIVFKNYVDNLFRFFYDADFFDEDLLFQVESHVSSLQDNLEFRKAVVKYLGTFQVYGKVDDDGNFTLVNFYDKVVLANMNVGFRDAIKRYCAEEDPSIEFEGLVSAELAKARKAHKNIRSYHEGLAVILEEFDEFKEEVFRKHVIKKDLKKELVQLAAMCQRFYEDLM